MLDRLAQKILTRLPENRRDATIGRARSWLNFGYRLYAMPLRLGTIPFLSLSKSTFLIGTPIPRFYWNDFLTQHRNAFRGHGIEVGSDATIRRIGGAALTKVDVLNISPGSGVTIVADLCTGEHIPSNQFDVFLNQFTLHMVLDHQKALYHSLRMLKPGGRLVVSFPCVSGYPAEGVPYSEPRTYVERWFTPIGVERLLNQFVPSSSYEMQVYGNRHARASYVLGIGSESLPSALLRKHDPHWPVAIGAVITKPDSWQPAYVPPDEEN
jgi:SAM-dependent methyltransferase